MDYILASMEYTRRMELIDTKVEEITADLGPPAFLYRKFRSGNETWEILPRLLAEWTIAAIPEREPNVARARLCLNIPKDVDQEAKDRMQAAFVFWLMKEKGERG